MTASRSSVQRWRAASTPSSTDDLRDTAVTSFWTKCVERSVWSAKWNFQARNF